MAAQSLSGEPPCKEIYLSWRPAEKRKCDPAPAALWLEWRRHSSTVSLTPCHAVARCIMNAPSCSIMCPAYHSSAQEVRNTSAAHPLRHSSRILLRCFGVHFPGESTSR
ncbi:hypothetical protein BaRGS_00039055 [Batillaria attramentaria]|uniref:Uncharacterized protein n=1 Tax=Batillaria attramentaria TaxID=370345 RepID=A0ABD0J4B8_9CAEN